MLDHAQGAADWHPAPKPVLEAAAAARRAAESYGVDIGTLAIKKSVSAPGVAVHLMGMKTVEEVGGPPLRCLLIRRRVLFVGRPVLAQDSCGQGGMDAKTVQCLQQKDMDDGSKVCDGQVFPVIRRTVEVCLCCGTALNLVKIVARLAQVRMDVRTVLEALKLAEAPHAAQEEKAMREVSQLLKPHMDVTWPTGNANNRT